MILGVDPMDFNSAMAWAKEKGRDEGRTEGMVDLIAFGIEKKFGDKAYDLIASIDGNGTEWILPVPFIADRSILPAHAYHVSGFN